MNPIQKQNHKLITNSQSSTYYLASLLKEHLDDFIPTLADIINNSLQHGKSPDKLKNAAVQPLLKKANLPLEEKNYWPVSNLSYLGKLTERAACDQLVEFAIRTGNIE